MTTRQPSNAASSCPLAQILPSLLVANRGEIALRVMRTARRLGLRTIAVYSDADRDAPFVRYADTAFFIGPAPALDSYLRIDAILEAAAQTGAAAIHPGYGFLSERADFAEACAQAGLVFVGPPASAIRAMGMKDAAKALAERAGVPVVPGYHGARQEADFLAEEAARIGYPVLVKAVAGGGGKGMRRVEAPADFPAALAAAQREAQAAFGDPRVLIERYVLAPRHVEIQVFADGHGNVVHLFERDCSLQRRHQKVLEEAPAPGMDAATRAAMGQAAVEAARAVGYVGAGTVEFIADGSEGLRPDRFYFMEMNTRLQVEHPVTEAITGLDLVELQLRVAAGEPLPFLQKDLAIDGHAVEARLYAEDPEKGFLPSTGRLVTLRLPEGEGIRVDAGVAEGDAVTPFYDPMIAKIIAQGPTREAAFERLHAALQATRVAGPKTNLAFLAALTADADVRAGRLDTGLIDRKREALKAVPQPVDEKAAALGAACLLAREEARIRHATAQARGGDERNVLATDPWFAPALSGFGRGGSLHATALAEGERLDMSVPRAAFLAAGKETAVIAGDDALAVADGEGGILVVREGRQTRMTAFDPLAVDLEHLGMAGDTIVSPMHGKLVAVQVAVEEIVRKGQPVAVVEAMKMEHVLLAPRDGMVVTIAAAPGSQVSEGMTLIVLRDPA